MIQSVLLAALALATTGANKVTHFSNLANSVAPGTRKTLKFDPTEMLGIEHVNGYIFFVTPGGKAERLGLEAGSEIVAVNGVETAPEDLTAAFKKVKQGTAPFTVTVAKADYKTEITGNRVEGQGQVKRNPNGKKDKKPKKADKKPKKDVKKQKEDKKNADKKPKKDQKKEAEKKQKEEKLKEEKMLKEKKLKAEKKQKAEKKPKKAAKNKEKSIKEKKAKKASDETLDSVLQPTENELTAILGKFRGLLTKCSGIGKDVCPQNEAEEAIKILDMYKASVNKGQVAAREYRKRMLA